MFRHNKEMIEYFDYIFVPSIALILTFIHDIPLYDNIFNLLFLIISATLLIICTVFGESLYVIVPLIALSLIMCGVIINQQTRQNS